MKENGSDTPDKKRRKIPPPITVSPGSVKTEDVYKSVCALEEAEAESRDAETDKKLFHETCNAIRSYMDEIAVQKKKGTADAKNIVMEKCREASLLFVMLKKLNRLEKLRTKQSRDELHRVKSQVDSQHLQLQNLLYEVLHLQKEVKKCLQFKSQDEEIDLVPVDEFLKNAPESVKSSVNQKDAHQLQKARLEWELQQRRQLAEKCKQLHSEKEKVAQDIERQQQHLENLAPMLRGILQATKPVEESLGVKVEETRLQHQVAYLLPQPLFFLYVQADAHQQACDPLLSVTVTGDEEEARRIKQNGNEVKEDEDSDSDMELENLETSKRHHRKRSTKVDRHEERRRRLLLKHPLVVNLSVSTKDGSKVNLEFSYYLNLNIVTTKSSVCLAQPIIGVFASQLMTPESIIHSLFDDDDGHESPNPANHYQLHAVGLGRFHELVPQLGNPFLWAQRAAGLDFINSSKKNSDDARSVEARSELSQATIPNIVNAVRQRFKARLALCRQVESLESGYAPPVSNLVDIFPAKISSRVSEFLQITWSDYRSSKTTQLHLEQQLVGEHDFFYKIILSRGPARLIALVAVKINYPVSPPIFSLQIKWKGQHLAGDSDAVRDMEREVNVYFQELMVGSGWAQTLLVAQVSRLLYCFDVFLESGAESEEDLKLFPRDKVFIRATRGRNRARPYKYLNTGGGVFTQR